MHALKRKASGHEGDQKFSRWSISEHCRRLGLRSAVAEEDMTEAAAGDIGQTADDCNGSR